jgi:hypothetical protein
MVAIRSRTNARRSERLSASSACEIGVLLPHGSDVRTRGEQDPLDTELARLLYSPGVHALAADPVLVLLGRFEHRDVESRARQRARE